MYRPSCERYFSETFSTAMKEKGMKPMTDSLVSSVPRSSPSRKRFETE